MKIANARGIIIKGKIPIPKETVVTIRTETSCGFSTLSLADDLSGTMIQIAVTPEVKKILKAVIK